MLLRPHSTILIHLCVSWVTACFCPEPEDLSNKSTCWGEGEQLTYKNYSKIVAHWRLQTIHCDRCGVQCCFSTVVFNITMFEHWKVAPQIYSKCHYHTRHRDNQHKQQPETELAAPVACLSVACRLQRPATLDTCLTNTERSTAATVSIGTLFVFCQVLLWNNLKF